MFKEYLSGNFNLHKLFLFFQGCLSLALIITLLLSVVANAGENYDDIGTRFPLRHAPAADEADAMDLPLNPDNPSQLALQDSNGRDNEDRLSQSIAELATPELTQQLSDEVNALGQLLRERIGSNKSRSISFKDRCVDFFSSPKKMAKAATFLSCFYVAYSSPALQEEGGIVKYPSLLFATFMANEALWSTISLSKRTLTHIRDTMPQSFYSTIKLRGPSFLHGFFSNQ